MAVKIGHASIDERGKAHSGAAGDSTGKEVCTRNWYKHKKGWVVLRAKNPEVAEKMAVCMEAACANNCIGYDQYQRLTLYNAVKGNGFRCDAAALKTRVETDCSALVRVCMAFAGVHVDNFRTSNQRAIMLASGQFDELPYGDSDEQLRRGDVLVTKTQGHTVIVLSNGAGGDKVEIELSVLKSGSKGEQVKTLQRLLMALGYKLPKYGADGDYGVETEVAVKLYQRSSGLSVDGIAGRATWSRILKGS